MVWDSGIATQVFKLLKVTLESEQLQQVWDFRLSRECYYWTQISRLQNTFQMNPKELLYMCATKNGVPCDVSDEAQCGRVGEVSLGAFTSSLTDNLRSCSLIFTLEDRNRIQTTNVTARPRHAWASQKRARLRAKFTR